MAACADVGCVAPQYKDPESFTQLAKCKGKDLKGKKYKPLFTYFAEDYPEAFR